METREREAEADGRTFTLRYSWVPLSSIAPHLRRAVVLAEDASFYEHHGFDFAEMWKAVKESYSTFSFPRGASTITQQLVKNLYLTESKNPFRKFKEALITSLVELFLKKDRILELYLNVIEWGDGIFGVEAASRHYFGVSAAALSREQACLLAGIIPGPRGIFNPKLHPGRVENRKELICRRLGH